MGNGSGSYRTTPKRTMRAYDELPPSVRRALSNSVFDWAAQPWLTLLRRDGWTPKEIVEDIARGDRWALNRERKRTGRRE
jgi:hypothetical protein